MFDADRMLLRPIDLMRLARHLRCRDCGYDLRGLPLGGACPECGTPVWHTVLPTIDPVGSRLPRLHNPGAVGNGMVAAAFGLLVPCVLMTLYPAMDSLARLGLMRPMSGHAATRLCMLAGVLMLSGVLAAWMLWPRGSREVIATVVGVVIRLQVGAAVAAAGTLSLALTGGYAGRVVDGARTSFTWVSLLLECAVLGGQVLWLVAFARIVRDVGLRSREYRLRPHARQPAREMGIAAGIVAAAEVVRLVALESRSETVAALAAVVAAAAYAMFLIGLAFLFVNAIWIRRALAAPHPTLLELLRDPGPGEPDPGATGTAPDASAGTHRAPERDGPVDATAGDGPSARTHPPT